MTTIDKIRAEIERIRKEAMSITPHEPKHRKHYKMGKKYACEELLSFLDTLEEPVSDCHDLEEAADDFTNDEVMIQGEFGGECVARKVKKAFIAGAEWDAGHLRDSTKKISEDLESEIGKAGKDVLRQAHKHNKIFDIPQTHFEDVQLMDIFKSGVYKGYELGREAGAEWQARQLLKSSPLPEDTVIFQKGVEEGKRLMMDEWLKDRDGCFWDGVNEGKKAMKEQIMEGAVEGEVHHCMSAHYVTTNENQLAEALKRFNDSDKVRIIIVKEEEKCL